MKQREEQTGGGGVEPPGVHRIEDDLARFRALYLRVQGKREVIVRILSQSRTPCSGERPDAAPKTRK